MKFKKYKIFFESSYIFLLGIISSFSLPPYNFWIINFLTFSLLFVHLTKNKDKSTKCFFLYGYVFGFGYFISNLYWVPLSLLYDENFKSLIPLAIILIPALLSLFYAIAFSVFKLFFNSKSIFVSILSFSLIIGLFDFIRGTILSGFPWNLFAYSFSENIVIIQITSLIGLYAFNTILITIFSVPSILYLKKNRSDLLGFYSIIIITIFIYSYGSFKINSFKNQKSEMLNTEIKILSTNISIERFYSNLDVEEILLKLIYLSNPIQDKDTIFIWPEGIIPNINLKSLKNQYDYLFKKSFSNNQKIIFGINDYEIKNEKKRFYNSLSVINNEANILFKYHKNKLVPFGEFLPLENILKKFGFRKISFGYKSFSKGNERKLLYIESNKFSFIPLICYEIIYSGNINKEANRASFIINISEDGWFGNSIGPHQHFAHGVFRSIEEGKNVIRSTNNGISAFIDVNGRVVSRLESTQRGVIEINKYKKFNETLFSKFGNKIFFYILILYFILILFLKRRET